MTKKKKLIIISAVSAVCILVLGFVLYMIIGSDSGQDSGDVIYSKESEATIILGEGVSESDVRAISSTYRKYSGKEINIKHDDNTYGSHEIIIGKTEHPLSEKAYRLLSRLDYTDGYYICSDGRSVAIAFDEAIYGVETCFNEAVNTFVSKYMQTDTLRLAYGVVCYDSFDQIERQRELDEAEESRLWDLKLAQIKGMFDENDAYVAEIIVSSLQTLRGLYNNEEITIWLANLYDPVSGGFYYSNSARNNTGFLPDLESTSQALGLVESILTGYNGTLTDYFGEDISNKFIGFTKSMQDSTSGYFYHPQWGRDTVDKNPLRKDRDILSALYILNRFGASPTYDTPNGVKGDGIAVPVSSLVLPLRGNDAESAVKLVSSSEDDIYIPSHLISQSAFENYLSGLKIRSDTANVCQKLYSELPLYIRIDEKLEQEGESYRLSEILVNYLGRYQDASTGFWGNSSEPTAADMELLCDFIKIFNGTNTIVSHYERIFSTLVSYLEFTEEVDNINDISSAWSALAATVDNVVTFTPSHEYFQGMLRDSLASLYRSLAMVITKTTEKLGGFVKTTDGSFSTTPKYSASDSLGMPVALPLTEEGDVNGTLLAVKNTWISIFITLDIGYVPLFGNSDRMLFDKTLREMGTVIKHEIKKGEPITFEEDDVGENSTDVMISSPDLVMLSKAFISEGPEEKGKVLELFTPSKATTDQYHFYTSSLTMASCLIYEFDMCVLPETSTGVFANIYIDPLVYMITLDRVGDTVRFTERSTRSESTGFITDLGISAEVGEWFKLRVEYYVGTHDTVRIKVFFNEVCIAVTDNYFENVAVKYDKPGTPNSTYKSLAIYTRANKDVALMMDNVLTDSSYDQFKSEPSEFLNVNVDTPDKPKEVIGFESTDEGEFPDGFKAESDTSTASVTADADGNKVLKLPEGAGEILLPLDQRGFGVNSATIEFDITVSAESAVGAAYRISFNEFGYRERTFAAMQLIIIEENGKKYATLAEDNNKSLSTEYKNVRLTLGEKHRLQFKLFFHECALVVIADDEIVGINSNVLDKCKKYYMGETSIEALTPELASTVFIDNLVSERSVTDFGETTKPESDRVTYEFNNSDGMILSGISPENGVLSFESVRKQAYVNIPVNVRFTAQNMAIIGMDISTSEAASGTLILSFKDKAGNIISAFALVQNGKNVDIHEYTEHGIYPAKLYTVSTSSFNLSVEYSERRESFNLLIGGEYVAASSVSYTPNVASYGFESFEIGNLDGAAGFTVDNLYAEKVCGVFGAHNVYLANTDGKEPVYTYETSSFASLPENIEVYLVSPNASLLFNVHKVGDAVSKVLEFTSNKGADSSDTIVFAKINPAADSNAVFFETDMMLKSFGDRIQAQLSFRGRELGTAYRFNIYTKTVGDKVQFYGENNEALGELEINENTWFKLRLEYANTEYDYNYDGVNDIVYRCFVNGELVYEGHTPFNAEKIVPSDDIYQMGIYISKNMEGTVCLDNTCFGQFKMEYDEPYPADTDTITYEPGIITNKTQFTFGKNTSTAKITEITLEGAVTKVLEFYSSKSSEDKLEIVPTLTDGTANAISFETDILIDPISESAIFYLEPMTRTDKKAFRLAISADKDGEVTISSADIPETVIGRSGEWLHIKVEYMNPYIDYDGDMKRDILYKIYIGNSNEPTAVGYKPYNSKSYYDPLDIAKYRFTAEEDGEATVLLDNTRFWQVSLTPDEAPDFNYQDIDKFGEDKFDESGWTASVGSGSKPEPEPEPTPDDTENAPLGGEEGELFDESGWT